jgi:hypothetical protein
MDQLKLNDKVKTPQGRPGTIDQICEEFFHVKFDEPIKDILGYSTGGWYRVDHIQKMASHAPRIPQER